MNGPRNWISRVVRSAAATPIDAKLVRAGNRRKGQASGARAIPRGCGAMDENVAEAFEPGICRHELKPDLELLAELTRIALEVGVNLHGNERSGRRLGVGLEVDLLDQ